MGNKNVFKMKQTTIDKSQSKPEEILSRVKLQILN